MLPSLFRESGSSPQTEQDTRGPSPEEVTDYSVPDFFLRSCPRIYREPYLSYWSPKCWTENSDDDDDDVDDDESKLSDEEVMTLMQDPKKRYFAEKRRHEVNWRSLKMHGIPSREDDLDDWAKDWSDAYIVSLWFMLPHSRIKEKSYLATFDLLGAIRTGGGPYDKFCSLYMPFLERREGLDEFNFHFILWKFKRLLRLLNKDLDSDSGYLQRRRNCVCSFNNHEKWSECFYLNEQIRPKRWRPNRIIMDEINQQAQTDEVLASFIERHKKGRPTPSEIEDKNFDPHQIHAIFPIALKADSWKLEKIQNSFLILHTTYHICRKYKRFRSFVPVYPHLPENQLNFIGPDIDSLDVYGIGDVDIQATTADGKKKGRRIRLFNVRYCPMAPCNAISIPKCEASGVHWDKLTQILYEERDGMRKDIAKVEEHFGFSTLEYNPFHETKKDN